MHVSVLSLCRLAGHAAERPKQNNSKQVGWPQTEPRRAAIPTVDPPFPPPCRPYPHYHRLHLPPTWVLCADRTRARRTCLPQVDRPSGFPFLRCPRHTSRSCLKNPRSKDPSPPLRYFYPARPTSCPVRWRTHRPPYSRKVLSRALFRRIVPDPHSSRSRSQTTPCAKETPVAPRCLAGVRATRLIDRASPPGTRCPGWARIPSRIFAAHSRKACDGRARARFPVQITPARHHGRRLAPRCTVLGAFSRRRGTLRMPRVAD